MPGREGATHYGGHDLTTGPLIEGDESEGSRSTVILRANFGLKKVTELDNDGDGVFDERYTTEELSPDRKRRMLEKRAGPGAPWVVDYDIVGEPSDQQSGGSIETKACLKDVGRRFPQDIGAPRYGNAGIVIPYGGTGEGRCTATQGEVLRKAFECVQRKVDVCLRTLNPGVARTVRRVLGSRTPKVVVSCSFPCSEAGAQTATLGKGDFQFEAIELPPGVANMPPTMACEYLMHEVLHAVGVPQAPDHDAEGADRIYACARVCSGCSHATGAGEPDDRRDCATCASGSNKATCGIKPSVGEERIADSPPSCWNGAIPPSFAAGERRPVSIAYCDDTPAPDFPPAWCIEKCPAGFSVAGTGAGGWCSDFRGPDALGSSCKPSEALWLCGV